MVEIHLQHISRIYDAARPPAVNRVNIEVKDGEFLTLVGPSGSGKSTCLRMIAGLEPVNEGTVMIDGKDVTELPARDRDVAMVFQSYALYPNMTARQNMAFALENAGIKKAEANKRVEKAAKMLELEDLLDKKPANMSGGQRQRVSTRTQIAALQRELGVTTVYVTHDQTEALTMGDRVAVLKDGVLQQCDEPMHIYHHPGNTFVAGFIGSPAMAIFEGAVIVPCGSSASIGGAPLSIPAELQPKVKDSAIVGVHPEDWSITENHSQGLEVEVSHVEQLGAEAFAYVRLIGSTAAKVRGDQIAVKIDSDAPLEIGSRLSLVPRKACFFDKETEINYEYL